MLLLYFIIIFKPAATEPILTRSSWSTF